MCFSSQVDASHDTLARLGDDDSPKTAGTVKAQGEVLVCWSRRSVRATTAKTF
jgi:hypothetical protein